MPAAPRRKRDREGTINALLPNDFSYVEKDVNSHIFP
jgi:hypothetical protein